MTTFDYYCDSCGLVKNNLDMDSFICECGGQMRLQDQINGNVFKPYYCRTMKTYIKSSKHEDRTLRAKGFSYLDDHKSIKSEAAYIRKHKEEHIKDAYAKDGIKYKPGSNVVVKDEKNMEFTKRVAVFIGYLLLTSTLSYAWMETDYADITVNGKEIHFPIGNKERRMDVLLLKQALNGSIEARETFLGGEETRWFYIGDGSAKWLKVSKYCEEIITP